MPTQWMDYIRRNGELKVFNKATSWGTGFGKALSDFNALNLGVTLSSIKEQQKANIVVVLSDGSGEIDFSDPWYSGKVKPKGDFKPDKLHGSCVTAYDDKKQCQTVFCGIFLPSKVKVTDEQKRIVILHEFIHAAGLSGILPDGSKVANGDHDIDGIMNGQMKESGKGLIEYMPPKGAKAMPPIRINGGTVCVVRQLWIPDDECRP